MLPKILYLWLLAAVSLFYTANLYASHGGQYKKVDGVSIYLVIMPAEMLRGHPKEHLESSMHLKQRIEGRHQHHIMVSLFNAASGTLLKNVIISARVFGENFNGSSRLLELMIVGDTKSYGNFFNVPKQGSYRVGLEIQLKDKGKVINVVFQYASA